MKKRIIKLILAVISAVIIIMLAFKFYRITDISWRCPFNLITGFILGNRGLYCPGCGSTRAVKEFLKLNFAGGIKYNMLFPLEAFYILFVLCISAVAYIKSGKFNYRSPNKAFDLTVLIIVIIWGVIRNIFNI